MAQKSKKTPTLADRRTCHNGDRMTPENTFTYTDKRTGRKGVWCGKCRARSRARANAKRTLHKDSGASREARAAAREFLAQTFHGKRWDKKPPTLAPLADSDAPARAKKRAETSKALDAAFSGKAKRPKRPTVGKAKRAAKKSAKATGKGKATAKAKPAAKRPKRAARARAA